MAETENQKTLLDVCAEIWRGKIFISAGICAGIILAMGFLLTATPHYRAQVILSPANTMNGAEVSSPVAEESLLALRYLAQRMGAANPSDFMRFENTFSGPTVAEMLLKDERVEQDLGDEKALESPSALAEYIDRRVRIDAVGATPMRRMTYLHPDGKFAAYFLRALHHVTDGLIRQKIRQEATQRVRYLQEAAATTSNPDHKRALTTLLMEQERLLMLVSIDMPYAASVVEPPAAGSIPAWPEPALVILAAVFAGAVLGFAIFGFVEAAAPVAQEQAGRKRAWFRTDSRNNNERRAEAQPKNQQHHAAE